MSAYGALPINTLSRTPLPSTIWPVRKRDGPGSSDSTTTSYLSLHHLTLSRAAALPGLLAHLHSVFARYIDEGLTYPQEVLPNEAYSRDAFEAYFFAGDVVLGIVENQTENLDAIDVLKGAEVRKGEAREIGLDVDFARAGRSWEECVAGFYYVGFHKLRSWLLKRVKYMPGQTQLSRTLVPHL
jgi:hypothetical protein